MKFDLKNSVKAIANSYSQVFFSQNTWLALFCMLASFINPLVGICGLASVIIAFIIGRLIGLNATLLNNGTYTYNVLLSGMALACLISQTSSFCLLLVLVAILSLLLSVWLAGFFYRYNLPFLSLPFVLSIWIVLLNGKHDGNLVFELSNNCNQFELNYIKQPAMFIESFAPAWLLSYFKTLSFIVFQKNIVAGCMVALGLLLYSRIAFSLSIIGFLSGGFFFQYFQNGDVMESMSANGFNYIFASLSLCGFFLIPNLSSYLLAILSAPFIYLISMSLQNLIAPTHLPLYSLPFSFFVIIILSVLINRTQYKYFLPVQYQLNSPEKNLYAYSIYMERFKKDTIIHIHLPFYGEWLVTQSYNGKQTHQGDYRYAWDFEVADNLNKTFKGSGKEVTDYYCYALPILAPADGYVVTLKDSVEDNRIGDVNLNENWGNSIVIKHTDNLFSKISHIKNESFKVKLGDYVRRGDIIALCGNSGRSPVPHIHFQIQNTDKIGAKTIQYPISYFVTKDNSALQLKAFESPEENTTVFKPLPNEILKKAFHFIPGMKMSFEVDHGNQTDTQNWEVFTNSNNHSYIYCHTTGATAYFTNNQTLFYFTSFIGNKKSLLYQFFLSAYKVLLADVKDLSVEDNLPVETTTNYIIQILQDFIAPFYIFTKPFYSNAVELKIGADNKAVIVLKSEIKKSKNSLDEAVSHYEILMSDKGIDKITIYKNNLCIKANHIS